MNQCGQGDPASNTLLTKLSASAFPKELDFELVLHLWIGGCSASELKQNSEACPC